MATKECCKTKFYSFHDQVIGSIKFSEIDEGAI